MAQGQRCEVQPGGRRGQVEFVGEVEGLQVTVVTFVLQVICMLRFPDRARVE